jgi:hypothetical protein
VSLTGAEAALRPATFHTLPRCQARAIAANLIRSPDARSGPKSGRGSFAGPMTETERSAHRVTKRQRLGGDHFRCSVFGLRCSASRYKTVAIRRRPVSRFPQNVEAVVSASRVPASSRYTACLLRHFCKNWLDIHEICAIINWMVTGRSWSAPRLTPLVALHDFQLCAPSLTREPACLAGSCHVESASAGRIRQRRVPPAGRFSRATPKERLERLSGWPPADCGPGAAGAPGCWQSVPFRATRTGENEADPMLDTAASRAKFKI